MGVSPNSCGQWLVIFDKVVGITVERVSSVVYLGFALKKHIRQDFVGKIPSTNDRGNNRSKSHIREICENFVVLSHKVRNV